MLVLNNIQDASKIKGTGYKGQLSKGDVLAFLGKVDNPQGTYKAQKDPIEAQKQLAKQVRSAAWWQFSSSLGLT